LEEERGKAIPPRALKKKTITRLVGCEREKRGSGCLGEPDVTGKEKRFQKGEKQREIQELSGAVCKESNGEKIRKGKRKGG